MRVELRLEVDEHEFATSVECDQAVPWDVALQAAVNALDQVVGAYAVPAGIKDWGKKQ